MVHAFRARSLRLPPSLPLPTTLPPPQALALDSERQYLSAVADARTYRQESRWAWARAHRLQAALEQRTGEWQVAQVGRRTRQPAGSRQVEVGGLTPSAASLPRMCLGGGWPLWDLLSCAVLRCAVQVHGSGPHPASRCQAGCQAAHSQFGTVQPPCWLPATAPHSLGTAWLWLMHGSPPDAP